MIDWIPELSIWKFWFIWVIVWNRPWLWKCFKFRGVDFRKMTKLSNTLFILQVLIAFKLNLDKKMKLKLKGLLLLVQIFFALSFSRLDYAYEGLSIFLPCLWLSSATESVLLHSNAFLKDSIQYLDNIFCMTVTQASHYKEIAKMELITYF